MRIPFFFCSLLYCLCVFAQTKSFSLDNGLKIIIRPDHRAPVAAVMVWYQVGSADDPSGKTGLSHVLEHMMFKGTPTYPQGVFSETIRQLGGQENAFTNHDYTAYYTKIAVSHLEQVLALEADRMRHLSLDPDAFTQEIKVIQEERRMRTDDNPQALAFERFLAAAHLITPYHQPVIGWMDDLQHLTIDDVRQWYQQFYAPNHATVVIAGDVTPEQAYEMIKKHFSGLEPGTHYLRKAQVEPPSLGTKIIEVQAKANIPLLIQGYTVPSVKSIAPESADTPYVLEVIAALLGAGDSARLQQHLVREQQCAADIGMQYNLYTRYENQFAIYAIPSQTCDLNQLRAAIKTEWVKLQQEPVSASELQRVKTQLIAQKTFEKDSLLGQAMELGLLETIEVGWQAADKYIEKLNAVNPETIQQIANQYFQPRRLTEATLIPEGVMP